LAKLWSLPQYLIIDEISMCSKDFFAKLSRTISIARLANDSEALASKTTSALYCPVQVTTDSEDEKAGRRIYEQFSTVVILKEQCRVQDQEWLSFLHRTRYGVCTAEDLRMLRSLLITSPSAPYTNYQMSPWNDAVLITSRHIVRNNWNNAAISRLCHSKKQTLLISRAFDTIGKRQVTSEERYRILTRNKTRGKGRNEQSGLPQDVPLVIGMEVMVTLNVQTDLDVANGARGQLVGIGLDENEPAVPQHTKQVILKRPPTYVLVKLYRTKAKP
ncbi:hypothetical protein CALCODRAFT_419311, partial [Calocera cornea HHB12733]